MEANQDEAARVRQVAQAALKDGDAARAVKLLSKAQKLYPTEEGARLLSRAVAAVEGGGADEDADADDGASAGRPPAGAPPAGSPQLRHRRHESANGVDGGPAATAEQIATVQRIRRTANYYEILEVAKTCSDEDIRRAYRKLSLKVHPDKNRAPGSEEAFKAVSKAFSCLSDEGLRANYDRYGHEDPQQIARMQQQQQQRQRYAAHNAHDPFNPWGGGGVFGADDFDPNDIFNAFFGFQHPQQRVYRTHFGPRQRVYRQQQQQQQQHAQAATAGGVNLLALLQLLPLLAILIYALLPAAEPAFSLQRTATYTQEHRTAALGVPYYTKAGADFEREHPVGSGARQKLERRAEADYREHIEVRCYYERVQQSQYYRWGEMTKAREMAMPMCDELRRLQRAW